MTASAPARTAGRTLARLQEAVERAEWRTLFALTGGMVGVGALTGLASVYAVGFVLVCGLLGPIAYRSSRAACVLVALTSPVVALGSVDLGFHMVPAYLFVAAGALGVLRRGELRQVRVGLPELALLGFVAVAVIVTLANVGRVPNPTVIGADGANGHSVRWLAQGAALLTMAALYALIRAGVRDEDGLTGVLRALLVATLFVGGYALYQIVGRELDFPYTFVNERRPASSLPEEFRYIRVNGTLTEASPLGQFAAVSLSLGAAWLVAGVRRAPWLTRRLTAVIALGGAGLVFATLSKSAGLACLIWLPILVAAVPGPGRRRRLMVVGASLLACLAVAGATIAGPLADIGGQRGASSERYVRVGYWIAAVDIARDNPFGIGVGNYTFYYPRYASLSTDYEYSERVTDAHNLSLEAFAETGLIGGALFVTFGLALVAGALRAARRTKDTFLAATAWGIAIAFAIGVTMHFTYSYFYFPFEWVLAGLLGALPYLTRARVQP